MTYEQLDDIESKVKTMTYHPSVPLIKVTNEIKELERLALAGENPMTDKQKVTIGMKIIKNTNDFEDGITDWYKRPVAEHTWDIFKQHFEDARELLRKIRGTDMTNTAYHQANLVANSVRFDMART